MSLGENIKSVRKQKGWSQRELAGKVDFDPSYINRIETGKLNPSILTLERISNALECSLDRLVRGEAEAQEVHIRDKNLLERMRLLDTLEEDDRNAMTHMIDALLTKKRIKELLEGGSKVKVKSPS